MTGEEGLCSPQTKPTPHVTMGACVNCRGDAPPPLLVLAGFQCGLGELATLQQRSLWLAAGSSGWVDRLVFRQWCR